MKTQSSSKKTIIIGSIIVVVFLVAYFYFSGGSAPANSGSLTQSQPSSSATVGMNTLSLLNQIQSLRIDTSIFKDRAYQTLTDYSVAIPQLNVGRPNPFAPLPGMPATPAGQ